MTSISPSGGGSAGARAVRAAVSTPSCCSCEASVAQSVAVGGRLASWAAHAVAAAARRSMLPTNERDAVTASGAVGSN